MTPLSRLLRCAALTAVTVLAGTGTASAALDPDIAPDPAAATAPRVEAARAYAAPDLAAALRQATTARTIDFGTLGSLEAAFFDSTLVDLAPLRELLADAAVAERYMTSSNRTCVDPGFQDFVSPELVADIVRVRGELGVLAPAVSDDACDPQTILDTALRDPETFTDNTSPITLAIVVRGLLAAGRHVRTSAVDTLAERGGARYFQNAPLQPGRIEVTDGLIAARDAGYPGLSGVIDGLAATIATEQRQDGSFEGNTLVSSKAAVTLARTGYAAEAKKAAAYITRVQFTAATAAVPADAGAVGFSYSQLFDSYDAGGIAPGLRDGFVRTSAQAVPGLIAGAYAPADPVPPASNLPGPPAPAPVAPGRTATPVASTPRRAKVTVGASTPRLSSVARSGVLGVRYRLDRAARGTALLTISRAGAKRLGIRTRRATLVLARARVTTTRAGTATLRFRLSRSVRRKLAASRRPVRLTVRITVRTAAGTSTTSRAITARG